MIGRYLNTTMYSVECRGGNIVRDPFQEKLEDLLFEWDLVDVKPHNGKYTWSNQRVGGDLIISRLFYFLIHNSWLI